MIDVSQAIMAKGGLGIGLGHNYMGGNTIHADMVPPGPGQSHTWKNIANANAALFKEARDFALMPEAYYAKNLPQVGAPTPFRPDQPNPNNLRPSSLEPFRDVEMAGVLPGGPGMAALAPNGLLDSPFRPDVASAFPARSPDFIGPTPTMPSLDAAPAARSLASMFPGGIGGVGRMPLGPVDQAAPSMPSQAALSPVKSQSVADVLSPVSAATAAPMPSRESILGIETDIDPARFGPRISEAVITAPKTGRLAPISVAEAVSPPGLDVAPSMMDNPGLLGAPATLAQQDAALTKQQGIISPVPNAPQQVNAPVSPVAPSPMDAFPGAPPAAPQTGQRIRNAMPVAKGALRGFMMGGPIGGVVGGALCVLPQIDLGPSFDDMVPASDRFSTGFGLPGINAAMSGPRGAQGFSVSNPGMSFTSLGKGMGLRRSEKFGWTEVVKPDGAVAGIRYDNNGGGVFGQVARGVAGVFGGKQGRADSISPAASKATSGGTKAPSGGGLY